MANVGNTTKIKKIGVEADVAGIGNTQVGSGTLEWYKITEQTRYVLNNALAGYIHKRLAEKRKQDSNNTTIISICGVFKYIEINFFEKFTSKIV